MKKSLTNLRSYIADDTMPMRNKSINTTEDLDRDKHFQEHSFKQNNETQLQQRKPLHFRTRANIIPVREHRLPHLIMGSETSLSAPKHFLWAPVAFTIVDCLRTRAHTTIISADLQTISNMQNRATLSTSNLE